MKRLHLLCFVLVLFMNMVSTSMLAERSSNRVNALIVVDVQNCFISGNLALIKNPAGQDGAEVVPIINHLIETIPFDVIVYTYDWHPSNHISFYENLDPRRQYLEGDQNRTIEVNQEVVYTGPRVKTNQVLWPSHCVAGTNDAALHKNLHVVSEDIAVIHLKKGIDPDIDSYSAFADNNQVKKTELDEKLKEQNVTHVFVTGLATDYCVAATALDAFNLNYTTYLVEDASRGVDLNTIKSKLDDLKQRGVKIIQTNQVQTFISSATGKSLNFLLIISINVLLSLFK